MQQPPYRWYDSKWLYCYTQAREYLAENFPDRLIQFEETFEPLRTRANFKPVVLDDLIPADRLTEFCSVIDSISVEEMEDYEKPRFGRTLLRNHEYFTTLQQELTSLVSQHVGEEVEPCYNFLSLYHEQGYCEPHMDAPEAKWTLDICIRQSAPWPIYFSDIQPWPENLQLIHDDWAQEIIDSPNNNFKPVALMPGQAVIFSGSSQWHYRKQIPGFLRENYCHLIFLHYIPAGCAGIVDPHRWGEYFAIPQLNEIDAIRSYLRE